MSKSKTAIVRKAVSADDQLTEHLKQAENHLISAVNMLIKTKRPDRPKEFVERLTRAQELVTWVVRDELVLRRGPMKAMKIRMKR